MAEWMDRYLSKDDLLSFAGYVVLIVFGQLMRPPTPIALSSLFASGMLAIIWLAGRTIRARNVDRYPNVRVVIWAIVAIASGIAAR